MVKFSKPHAEVRVSLAGRSYGIFIGSGITDEISNLILPLLKRKRTVIVTDTNVADLHLSQLSSVLNSAGILTDSIILPAGEATKSFSNLEYLTNRLLEHKVERNDVVIAFGGGVIGDITGFAAAILRRGIDFIQIPTTLLAQVDSSVGGKTAINSSLGKNLIGAFHQPIAVFADIKQLNSLSKRQFKSGYAEVVKYGLLGDKEFYNWLDDNLEGVMAHNHEKLLYAIEKSCQAKANIVANDEKEGGIRALLNLGHSFGHALESVTGYSDILLHGEAVAIGMVMAFKFSERLGICNEGLASEVAGHLVRAGLPTKIRDINFELPDAKVLLQIMRQDKKARNSKIILILTEDIGKSFIVDNIDEDELHNFLIDQLAN